MPKKNTALLNSWLYSRPKYAILHARFLIWSLNFLAVFLAGFCTCCKLYSDPNPLPCPSEVNVLLKYFELFLSTWHWTSLFICSLKRTNSLICSRSSLENHARFQTIMSKIYIHFQTKTAQKSYVQVWHIHTAYLRECSPLLSAIVRFFSLLR